MFQLQPPPPFLAAALIVCASPATLAESLVVVGASPSLGWTLVLTGEECTDVAAAFYDLQKTNSAWAHVTVLEGPMQVDTQSGLAAPEGCRVCVAGSELPRCDIIVLPAELPEETKKLLGLCLHAAYVWQSVLVWCGHKDVDANDALSKALAESDTVLPKFDINLKIGSEHWVTCQPAQTFAGISEQYVRRLHHAADGVALIPSAVVSEVLGAGPFAALQQLRASASPANAHGSERQILLKRCRAAAAQGNGEGRQDSNSEAAQQRSRQTTYSSGSVGSGDGSSESPKEIQYNGRNYEVLAQVRLQTGAKSSPITLCDYNPYASNGNPHIPHEHGVYIEHVRPDVRGLYAVKQTNKGFIGFRRESTEEPSEVEGVRKQLKAKPNVLMEWIAHQGAIRRSAQTPEQRAKLNKHLQLRIPRPPLPTGLDVNIPTGHSLVSFKVPLLPQSYPVGNCPLSVLHAVISGFLGEPPAWWDDALRDFFEQHAHIKRPDPEDTSTWWAQADMNVLLRFLPPRLGNRRLQLTKQGAFLDALDQAGRRHLGLLESRAVLLVCVAQGDNCHWILADGRLGVWYPLGGTRALYILAKKDTVSETAAAQFFRVDLQVDAIKLVYTLAIGPAVPLPDGVQKRPRRGSKGGKRKRKSKDIS